MSVAMSCHLTSTCFVSWRVRRKGARLVRRSSYRERDYAFGELILSLRSAIGLTQAGLSDHLGISKKAVGEWEAGSSYPKATHLKALIALAVKEQVWAFGHEEEEIRALWKAAHQKVLLDETWLSVLLSQPPAPAAQVAVAQSGGAQVGSPPTASQTSLLVLWSLSLAWACLAACKQGARA